MDQIRKRPFFWTDFPGGGSTASAMPFSLSQLSGGAFVIASSPNHPGQVVISSGVNANSGYVAWLAQYTGLMLSGAERLEWIWSPSRFTDTIHTGGFQDTLTVAQAVVDGVYFVVDGSGNLIGRARSNSSDTDTAVMWTLTAGEWYRFAIELNEDASIATFSVFNEAGVLLAAASVASNIPTGRETGVALFSTYTPGGVQELSKLDWASFGYGRDLAR